VLDAMPASWLIGPQVYRVFGGIFLVGWASGVVPGLFVLPAGIGMPVEHPEYRGRALSDRPDPGLCGAELNPAARAVVAPAAPSPALKARAQPGLTSG
jgi:hypothetical protein